jgi:hypothetical protein
MMPTVEKRGCKSKTVVYDHTSNFLQWDVPMSRVIHAAAAQSTVTVTSGFTIANALAVSIGYDLTLVEDFLKASTSLTYTETWTSSYTVGYTFPVPQGLYGAVVSNPQTTRHYGEVFKGCVGSMTQAATYQANSYRSQTYDSLNWVLGSITACTSTTYPIPMCIGGGIIE